MSRNFGLSGIVDLNLTLFRPLSPFSNDLDSSPPINLQASAGDKLRLIASQKQTVIGNVRRIRKSSQRHVAKEILDVLGGERHANEGLKTVVLSASKHCPRSFPHSLTRDFEMMKGVL